MDRQDEQSSLVGPSAFFTLIKDRGANSFATVTNLAKLENDREAAGSPSSSSSSLSSGPPPHPTSTEGESPVGVLFSCLPASLSFGRAPLVMTSEGLASAPRLERLLAPLGSGSERDLLIDETET